MIVPKKRKAYEEWRQRFERKEVTKTYRAWCWGESSERRFVVDRPIGHLPGDHRKMALGTEAVAPFRQAITYARVVEEKEGKVLIELTCQTGVMHQVRVHLTSRSLPLVGDSLYDSDWAKRPEKPSHHQLRAIRLQTEEFVVEAALAEFSGSGGLEAGI
jgi:23S rRNA pseudouridine1911/1915/1917 synthase